MTITPKLLDDRQLSTIRGDFEMMPTSPTPRPYTAALLGHIDALTAAVETRTVEAIVSWLRATGRSDVALLIRAGMWRTE